MAVRTFAELGGELRALHDACSLGDPSDGLPESIGVRTYLSILDTAARLLGDPFFGLHLGERVRASDAIGYGTALMACPTLRETTALTLRFECLCHDLGRTELIVDGDRGIHRWHTPWGDLPGGRHLVESAAAASRVVNDWLAGQALPVCRTAFVHRPPDGVATDEYARVLGGPVEFGAPFNETVFDAAILDIRLPNADANLLPQLLEVVERRFAARVEASGASAFIGRVRAELRALMLAGSVGLDELAAAVETTPRTLQRRLAENGAGYSELLDDVRRELAGTMLAEADVSLVDVAFVLGFAEQSTFNRAFRRWFGMSPSKWRRSGSPPPHAAGELR